MDPTQQALQNRLNPTPVTFQLPSTEGLFRGVGDYGTTLYRRAGNRVEAVNLVDMFVPQAERASVGNSGSQASLALQRLKDTYGLDYNSLNQVNIGDLQSQGYDQGLQMYQKAGPDGGPNNYINPYSGDITSFLGAKQNSTLAPTTVNTEKNTVAPALPANDPSLQPKGPVQQTGKPGMPATQPGVQPNTQSGAQQGAVSFPQTNLQPGQSGAEVKQLQDFLISQGYNIPDGSTGFYGPQTKAALTKFQQDNGVQAGADAGFYGPKTRAAIQAMQGGAADDGGVSKPTTDATNIADGVTSTNAGGGEKSLMDVVKEISTAMGLTDINSEIKKFDDQFAEDVKEVNLNPWLSEAARSKRVSAIQDKYENKKNALVDRLKLQSDAVASAVDYYQKERQYKLDVFKATMSAKASNLDTQVVDANGRKILINSQTGAKIADIGASEVGGGGLGGSYTSKQLTAITKLNQDVSTSDTYKKTNSMRGYADNVIASLGLGTGVGDIAAINQFQKVIDEGAVTRDQDVQLIQSAQSLVNTLQTKMKGLQAGEKLSPDLRLQMKNAVGSLYDAQVKALLKDPYIQAKTREAQLNDLTLEDTILGGLGGFSKGTTAKPGSVITGTDKNTGVKGTYIVGPDGSTLTPVGTGKMSTIPR